MKRTPFQLAFDTAPRKRQQKLKALGLTPVAIKNERNLAGWAKRHVSEVLGLPQAELFPDR